METFSSKIQFLKTIFGRTFVARDGVNVAVSCPACSSGSGKLKLSINIETWNCHCWVCGVKGKNPYNIIKSHVGLDEAANFLSRFSDSSFDLSGEKKPDHDNIVRLPGGFEPLFGISSSRDPDARACLKYLKTRGLTKPDLWYWKLGTCTSGKFRRRIIVPSFDSDGELNYFSARTIDESIPKYVNSKNRKSDIIFNDINIDWQKELTIVEGPFDLFKCNSNATCLLGSTLRKESFLFKRIAANKTPVLLSLDSDMREKSFMIAKTLSHYDCEVRIINLGDHDDVGEMTKYDFKLAKDSAKKWTRKMSLLEKISSIQTGSLI